MCQAPVEYPCPYPDCSGMIPEGAETCPVCGREVGWDKDPNREPPIKPIRPGRGS